MVGFSAASAAERCALGIHTRPSSPASRQRAQQPAPLRRGRRTATLSVSGRSLVVPRAVAEPADRASHGLVGRFTLDSNSELQVTLNPVPQGSVAEINLEVTQHQRLLDSALGCPSPGHERMAPPVQETRWNDIVQEQGH